MPQIILKDVRLSFPRLWTAKEFTAGDGRPRYDASFIVETGSDNDKIIRAAINTALLDKFGPKDGPKQLKALEGNSNKFCYEDGDKKAAVDGYEGNWILNSHRAESDGRPCTIDRSKNPVTEKDGILYGGCYVNAKVDIYAQGAPNAGVRCGLATIQFFRRGESFGGASPATDDGMDDLGYEEGEEEGSDDDLC